MSLRVVLVDDHTLVRAGIASLLRDIEGVEVVAEGANGAEAVQLVAAHHPDALLLDLTMPVMSGFEALPRIREIDASVRILVLSMHASEEHVIRALQLGASGYLLKEAAPEEVAEALAAIMAHRIWLSAAVSGTVIDDYTERNATRLGNALTERQLEVLRLLVAGLGTREISERLDLSVKTIETHRAQIMERLGLHDLASLVKYAIREGLTTL